MKQDEKLIKKLQNAYDKKVKDTPNSWRKVKVSYVRISETITFVGISYFKRTVIFDTDLELIEEVFNKLLNINKVKIGQITIKQEVFNEYYLKVKFYLHHEKYEVS